MTTANICFANELKKGEHISWVSGEYRFLKITLVYEIPFFVQKPPKEMDSSYSFLAIFIHTSFPYLFLIRFWFLRCILTIIMQYNFWFLYYLSWLITLSDHILAYQLLSFSYFQVEMDRVTSFIRPNFRFLTWLARSWCPCESSIWKIDRADWLCRFENA